MIGIAKGMVTTFKHLFKPTFTIQYPNVKRQLPERSRMSFALGIDESGAPQCKACLLCEKSCPDDAITIESERREGAPGRVLKEFSIDLGRCMYCGHLRGAVLDAGPQAYRGFRERIGDARRDHSRPVPRHRRVARGGARPGRHSAGQGGRRVSLSLVFFYVYAAIAIAGAVGLLRARMLVHAVMSLFVTLLAIAALYLLLGSQFLAAMQLFVYGGAITILVLFVLMLASPSPERIGNPAPAGRWVAAGATLVLFGVLALAMVTARLETSPGQPPDTAALAELLFSRYVLPFEIAGLLLTIALVGAIVLARMGDTVEARRGADEHSQPDVSAEVGGVR